MIPSQADPASRRSTALTRLIVPGFFVGFLMLQIVVPIVQATGQQPARFSWQMFANRRDQPAYTVVLGDGSLRPIDMRDVLGYERIELDYGNRVAQYLCHTIPNAASIREQAPGSQSVTEIPCP
jgi:hypothetical protein